ncbi:hypothetical protein ABNF65_19215 [Paenibacillus larvae]
MNEQYFANEDVYAVYDNKSQLAYVGKSYEEAFKEYEKCKQDLKESPEDTVSGDEEVMLLKVLRGFYVYRHGFYVYEGPEYPPDPDYVQYGFRECMYEEKGDERDGNKGQ